MTEKGWIYKKTNPKDKGFLRIYLSERAKELKSRLVGKREQ
jgi:hypothetical protein